MTGDDRFGVQRHEIYVLATIAEDLCHRHMSTVEESAGQAIVPVPAIHAEQMLVLVTEIARRTRDLEAR
ncbi:hypothetical protein [Rhizobium glycinendophyticum]|uniref:Uncharacterized protein n=1 Tax=Rhizobium glycinendophyticum TaxID=2589807 RepID=A0A504UNW6_9HYPH|nr:hypothetical protein [Rhizobium glycinendophyticum]TPP07032.1 hypothetical protein FJQ55_15330 [Rhizobium glycinendophyticum]